MEEFRTPSYSSHRIGPLLWFGSFFKEVVSLTVVIDDDDDGDDGITTMMNGTKPVSILSLASV